MILNRSALVSNGPRADGFGEVTIDACNRAADRDWIAYAANRFAASEPSHPPMGTMVPTG